MSSKSFACSEVLGHGKAKLWGLAFGEHVKVCTGFRTTRECWQVFDLCMSYLCKLLSSTNYKALRLIFKPLQILWQCSPSWGECMQQKWYRTHEALSFENASPVKFSNGCFHFLFLEVKLTVAHLRNNILRVVLPNSHIFTDLTDFCSQCVFIPFWKLKS